MNNAAINVGIQVSLQDSVPFLLDVYPEAGLLHYGNLTERHFNEFFHGCDEWMYCMFKIKKLKYNFGCVISGSTAESTHTIHFIY